MRQRIRKTELLSPAGSLEAAKAAVNAGADAVYMGGPLFSARAYALSSEKDMLSDAIDYCRLRDVRVFMTLNTLMKESEFAVLTEYLKPYAEKGLDGVIVQDIGVMRLIRERFPQLELHVSTQAAVTGPHYAALLKKMGAKRIVLARELSLSEIKRIYDETGAELEVFAHGALCYSCNGQCLMSSFIGGRSGNRGRCAGTCRLPYAAADSRGKRLGKKDEKYILSMKDLNTAARLSEMIDAGVYSFKIEGRMKSPVYVAAATSVYRKYLDIAEELCSGSSIDAFYTGTADKSNSYKGRSFEPNENLSKEPDKNNGIIDGTRKYRVSEEDMRLMSEGFERGGHTDGYLDHLNGRAMLALYEKPEIRIHDNEVINKLKKEYIEKDIKLPVTGTALFEPGKEPKLTLYCKYKNIDESVEVCGEAMVTEAENSPVSEEQIKERLSKFGGTDFELKELKITVIHDKQNCNEDVIYNKQSRNRDDAGFEYTEYTEDSSNHSVNSKSGIKKTVTKETELEETDNIITANTETEIQNTENSKPENKKAKSTDGIFIPLKTLNEMRREAVRMLKMQILNSRV